MSTKKRPLYKCSYCTLFWHLTCLIQPLTEIPENGWKCPRHLERSVTRRHLKKKNMNGDSVKVVQPEDDMPSLVANDIVKYGGVVYESEASKIEKDFLDYARIYRGDSPKSSCADEWLDSLPTFETDGVQLLIDALNMQEEEVELDDKEYEKFEAIEQLVKLKGEDHLLDLLSNN